ncbi:winged helix-turn-helix transcriptional regulator, partial [Kitasatospora sp. NPDC001574]
RRIEGVSQKMLTQTLRVLEADGFVARTVYPTGRLAALARIHSALSALLSASGSMATVLEQLATGRPVNDPAGLVHAARVRGAILLTSASAHLGAAACLLRTAPAEPPPSATRPPLPTGSP